MIVCLYQLDPTNSPALENGVAGVAKRRCKYRPIYVLDLKKENQKDSDSKYLVRTPSSKTSTKNNRFIGVHDCLIVNGRQKENATMRSSAEEDGKRLNL